MFTTPEGNQLYNLGWQSTSLLRSCDGQYSRHRSRDIKMAIATMRSTQRCYVKHWRWCTCLQLKGVTLCLLSMGQWETLTISPVNKSVSQLMATSAFPSHWDTNLLMVNPWLVHETLYTCQARRWDLRTWNTIDFEFVKA
jgi:hypothetical protein